MLQAYDSLMRRSGSYVARFIGQQGLQRWCWGCTGWHDVQDGYVWASGFWPLSPVKLTMARQSLESSYTFDFYDVTDLRFAFDALAHLQPNTCQTAILTIKDPLRQQPQQWERPVRRGRRRGRKRR